MNEERVDYTPIAVDKVPEPNAKRNVNIMSEETMATLRLNPDQWYRVYEYVGDEFLKIYPIAQSSCNYWKNKLLTRENLNLETRIRRSTPDKSVHVYARLSAGNNE